MRDWQQRSPLMFHWNTDYSGVRWLMLEADLLFHLPMPEKMKFKLRSGLDLWYND